MISPLMASAPAAQASVASTFFSSIEALLHQFSIDTQGQVSMELTADTEGEAPVPPSGDQPAPPVMNAPAVPPSPAFAKGLIPGQHLQLPSQFNSSLLSLAVRSGLARRADLPAAATAETKVHLEAPEWEEQLAQPIERQEPAEQQEPALSGMPGTVVLPMPFLAALLPAAPLPIDVAPARSGTEQPARNSAPVMEPASAGNVDRFSTSLRTQQVGPGEPAAPLAVGLRLRDRLPQDIVETQSEPTEAPEQNSPAPYRPGERPSVERVSPPVPGSSPQHEGAPSDSRRDRSARAQVPELKLQAPEKHENEQGAPSPAPSSDRSIPRSTGESVMTAPVVGPVAGPAHTLPTAKSERAEAPLPTALPPADPYLDQVPDAPSTARPGTVSLRLGDSRQEVQLQITDRQDGIHVAIRSGDQALSTALRQEVPVLLQKLEAVHYDAHAWIPGAATDITLAQMQSQNQSSDQEPTPGRHHPSPQDPPPDKRQRSREAWWQVLQDQAQE